MNLDTPELATAIAQPDAPGWAALRRGAFLLDQADIVQEQSAKKSAASGGS